MSGIIFEAVAKSADAPDIEPGLYDARFEGVESKFISGGQYGDGDRFVWHFTLLDDDGSVLYDGGDPIEVDSLTSKSMNTTSKTKPKALRYLQALLSGAEYDLFLDSKGIEAETLIGRVVQVDVIIRESGWPTVVNVLPKRRTRVRARSSEADEG